MHGVQPSPFIWHSNVVDGSEEVNVSVAENSNTVPVGPPVIVVSGVCCVTVQVLSAGVWSVFPTASVARTWKVCGPMPTPVSETADVHAAHGALSSRHW